MISVSSELHKAIHRSYKDVHVEYGKVAQVLVLIFEVDLGR